MTANYTKARALDWLNLLKLRRKINGSTYVRRESLDQA